METRYVHAELQRVRSEKLNVEQRVHSEKQKQDVEIERLHGELATERRRRFSSRTVRLTIKALKLQIAFSRIKSVLLPFKRRKQTAMIGELRSIVSAVKEAGGS